MTIYEVGVDASRYQKNINWKTVAQSGKQFAILRIGSSSSKGIYVDPDFLKNVTGAHAAGLKVGAYYYTYARSKAQVAMELDTFLSVLESLRLEYPVFVDVEDDTLKTLGRQQLTELVLYAMDILDQRGWYPGYYTYTNFADQYLDKAQLKSYPLWIADYRGYVGYQGNYDLWQYSASGKVSGVDSLIDLDYSYKNFLPILKAGGYNGYGEDEPQMKPISGKNLEVYAARCEYFYAPDVNDIVGYLPLGQYPATAISAQPYKGYTWVTFLKEGETYWTVLLDDRCRLVDAEGNCEQCRKELALADEKIGNTQKLLEQAQKELARQI